MKKGYLRSGIFVALLVLGAMVTTAVKADDDIPPFRDNKIAL
jgi:hypothetical protein